MWGERRKSYKDKLEILTIDAALDGYTEVWLTARDLLPELNEAQLALVVSLVVDTCPHCHKRDSSCECWNDE